MERERKKLLESKAFQRFDHPAKYSVAEYILAAYHKDSPLIHTYPTLLERRRAAVRQADLPEDLPWVQALITFELVPEPTPEETEEDPEEKGTYEPLQSPDLSQNYLIRQVINLIHYFLQVISCNNEYEMLISNQIVFWEFQQMMRDPVVTADDDKRLKAAILKHTLSVNSETIAERIKKLLSTIYADNEDMKKDAEKRMRMTPEMIARGGLV